jgi:hypothetical protein
MASGKNPDARSVAGVHAVDRTDSGSLLLHHLVDVFASELLKLHDSDHGTKRGRHDLLSHMSVLNFDLEPATMSTV